MKNFIIGALIIGVAIILTGMVVSPNVQYGASSGPTHTNLEYFYGGLIQGGPVLQKSGTAATTTFTATDICDYGTLKFGLSTTVGSASATLPSASSIISRCLQENGDTKVINFYNNNPLATGTVSFVAGTGDSIFFPDVTGTNGFIAGGNTAIMRFFRASSTAVFVTINEQAKQ